MGDLSSGMQSGMSTVDSVVSNNLPGHSEASIVSTTGGAHNDGSAHSSGNAVDIRVWGDPSVTPTNWPNSDPSGNGWISREQAAQCSSALQDALGADYTVLNEFDRPPNQSVWGGPHIHIQFNER